MISETLGHDDAIHVTSHIEQRDRCEWRHHTRSKLSAQVIFGENDTLGCVENHQCTALVLWNASVHLSAEVAH